MTHPPSRQRPVLTQTTLLFCMLASLWFSRICGADEALASGAREVNRTRSPQPGTTIAIVDAALIDGHGSPPLKDAVVVVRDERIVAVGPREATAVPDNADVVDAKGLTLLPGLLDAHFHLGGSGNLPADFLKHGITSVRDPGAWIESYDGVRQSGEPIPRLFLTGPHLDNPPAAYPRNSMIVRDPAETRRAVNRFIDDGASAIKVYFRLPLGLIRVVCETAHARGAVVVAHLEIVDARDAIDAGVDGIEHATSFGTALLPLREAEAYRQAMLADNQYRDEGRYRVWSELDLESRQAKDLYRFITERGTVVSPTLAVFERREGDEDTSAMHVRGFENMLGFVGHVHRAGGRVVVGSHSFVPHAARGWAYQREMELLVESGLSPMDTIVAGTMENARYFHVADRLGSVEAGKLADLLLIDGDPLDDIRAMYNVKGVMLGGRWVVKPE